jgi:hypothetical protein
VVPGREDRAVFPAFLGSIDLIVERDEPRAMIYTVLADQVGMDAADDPAKIFGKSRIILIGLDQFEQTEILLTFQAFAAAGTSEDGHFIGPVDVLIRPPTKQGLLILGRSLVLFRGVTDPAGSQQFDSMPVARAQGRL